MMSCVKRFMLLAMLALSLVLLSGCHGSNGMLFHHPDVR